MDFVAAWEVFVQFCSSVLKWTDDHSGAAAWFQGIGTIVAVYMAARIATHQTFHNAKQSRLDRLDSAQAYFDGFSAIAMEAFAPFAKLEDSLKEQNTPSREELKFCLDKASRGLSHVSGFPIHAIPGFKINRAAISIGNRLHTLSYAVETIDIAVATKDQSTILAAKERFSKQLDSFEREFQVLADSWRDHVVRENAGLR